MMGANNGWFGGGVQQGYRDAFRPIQQTATDFHVPPEAQNYTDLANQQAQAGAAANSAQTLENRPNQTNAFGSSVNWQQGPDGQWTQQQSFGGPLGGLSQSLQGQAAQSMGSPLNFSQFGAMPQAFNAQGAMGSQQMPGNAAGVGGPNLGALNPGVDPRTGMPDPTQARQQAIDAAFGQASSRLDPMWSQREEAMRTQLLNQGLDPTSEAYRNQMSEMGRQRNDAYQGALNSAIMQGTEAGNALFRQGLDQNAQHLGAQNQFFGQSLGANAQELARQGQIFGQGMGLDQLGLQAQNQFFGQNLAGQNQAFNQGMDARQQGITEMMMGRQQPLQDLLSMSGLLGQQGFSHAGAAPTPDLLGAGMAQDAAGLNRWNMRNQQIGETIGGVTDFMGMIAKLFGGGGG
jgi:hypothetical protein